MKVTVSTAPLLGLLGTVTGMLATFDALAAGSGGDKTMDLVAGGISEALITTETGLVIALPGLFFQFILARKRERYDAVPRPSRDAVRSSTIVPDSRRRDEPRRQGTESIMRRFRSACAQTEDERRGIDISPLIDCVFILLIFFIVTTTFVEETGVEVDKPQAASAVQPGEEQHPDRHDRRRARSSTAAGRSASAACSRWSSA